MCETTELVPIPALLWNAAAIHTFDADHPEYGVDGEGRRCLRLDACIVPVVQKLWAAGVVTLSCCCGHGDPWGVITIQTQAGVGQRGAMVMRVERYEALVAAESDLAAANATIAAQSLALATMREALEHAATWLAYLEKPARRLEHPDCWQGAARGAREDVMAILAEPADDAAALAGAVLAAADQMAEMMALMLGEDDEPDGDGGDVLIRMARARSAYRRARAALRGHGAAEG